MSRDVAVIARDTASFQLVCEREKLKPFEVLRVMHPDNLRGASLSRVIWESTPFNWGQLMIEEARANVDFALRVGEDPKLVGNAPMTRREAIGHLKQLASIGVDEAYAGSEAEHDKVRDAFRALGVSRQELEHA